MAAPAPSAAGPPQDPAEPAAATPLWDASQQWQAASAWEAAPSAEFSERDATAAPDAELAAARDRLLELAGQRPLDLDDPAGLDELATRIYPRLHRELRFELLVDRERCGLLSDFR